MIFVQASLDCISGRKLVAHTGQSSQLFVGANGRNAQFVPTVARSGLIEVPLTDDTYFMLRAFSLMTWR